MPRLYLIRHGQTDYNLQGIVQGGGIDSNLNATGQRQGKLFYETYKDISFDRVYCSELKRTYQTVQFFEEQGYEITRLKSLNEMNWGVLEGMAAGEAKPEYDRLNQVWTSGVIDHQIQGGESPTGVWARVKPGIEQIVEEVGEDGTALVCAHGRLLRIILSEMLGYGIQQMNIFPHENTGLNLLRRLSNGRWLAERLNDLSHLA